MTITKVDKITVARIGSGAERVLFVGDSVLFHYGPRVQKPLDHGRLAKTVIFVVGPSCSPFPGASWPDTFARCSAMSGIANSIADREETVIRGSLAGQPRNRRLRHARRHAYAYRNRGGSDSVYANFENEVQRLRKNGLRVALILGTPTSEVFNPGRMLSRSATGYRIDPQAFAGVPVATLMAIRESDDRNRDSGPCRRDVPSGSHQQDPARAGGKAEAGHAGRWSVVRLSPDTRQAGRTRRLRTRDGRGSRDFRASRGWCDATGIASWLNQESIKPTRGAGLERFDGQAQH